MSDGKLIESLKFQLHEVGKLLGQKSEQYIAERRLSESLTAKLSTAEQSLASFKSRAELAESTMNTQDETIRFLDKQRNDLTERAERAEAVVVTLKEALTYIRARCGDRALSDFREVADNALSLLHQPTETGTPK